MESSPGRSRWRAWLAPLRCHEPHGVDADAYWLATVAVLAFAVALGLQATVLSMLVFGPLAAAPPPEILTEMGRRNVRPESDLPAFVAGCLLTVLLGLAAVRAWSASLARGDAARIVLPGALAHLAIAAVSLGVFVVLAGGVGPEVRPDGRLPASAVLRLAAPLLGGALAWAALLVALRRRSGGRR